MIISSTLSIYIIEWKDLSILVKKLLNILQHALQQFAAQPQMAAAHNMPQGSNILLKVESDK